MNFWIKLFLEIVNLIGNNRAAFALAKYFKIFNAVFVMYPADNYFADYFTFRARQRFIKWKPFITGVATHPSGKMALMFAISSHIDGKDEGDVNEKARDFHTKVEMLRLRLGAVTTHFAGTLPSRLTALKVRRGSNALNERVATARNVVEAILHTRSHEGHTGNHLVVVLGSKGYIGREVIKMLEAKNIQVVGVDVDGVYKEGVFWSKVYTKPTSNHLLVNITHPEAINKYIDDQMDATTSLLNEVYPAPHKDVIESMKEKGVKVFHIAGVKTSVWPPFPSAYKGAVPCCAALPNETYEVAVVRL